MKEIIVKDEEGKEIEKFEISGDLLRMVLDYLKLVHRHSLDHD